MRMDTTIFPMQGYWGKYLGGLLCLVSLFGFGLIWLGQQDLLTSFISFQKQTSSLSLLLATGLFLFNFSKERVDDERVKMVRYTSLRAGFYSHFMMVLFFFFVHLLSEEFIIVKIEGSSIAMYIFMLMVIPQLTYLLIFQTGIRLDPTWIYTDNSAIENWGPKPVWRYLNMFIIALGIAALLLMLHF